MNPIVRFRSAYARWMARMAVKVAEWQLEDRAKTPAAQADDLMRRGLFVFIAVKPEEAFERMDPGGALVLAAVGIFAWAAVVLLILDEVDGEPTPITERGRWLDILAVYVVVCWFFPLKALVIVIAWAVVETMLEFRRFVRSRPL